MLLFRVFFRRGDDMKFLTLLSATALLIFPFNSMANDYQERYEIVKDETMHSGTAGFDRRHKAFSRFVMDKRRAQSNAQTDSVEPQSIEPASGEEKDKSQSKKQKITYNN